MIIEMMAVMNAIIGEDIHLETVTDYRNDGRDERDNRRGYPSGNRNRSTKDRVEPKIDKDGFTEVAKGTGTNFKYGSTPKILSRDSKPGTSRDNKSARSGDRQSQKQHQNNVHNTEPE